MDGSSTVYPITEAVAEDFMWNNSGANVTIGVSGTGGGFKKFIRNEIDITNASRPIKAIEDEETKKAGIDYLELPIAFDGLAIVVHPQNTWVDYLTVEELKKIWQPEAQSKVKKWNQIRPEWPNKEIHLFGAGTQSGTFDYFTEAIVGTAKSSRGDYTASEDDNVLVQGISSDVLALGYFGLDYYEANQDKLKLVPIDNGHHKGPIIPTQESISSGIYQPLSRPLLLYVNQSSLERPEVLNFLIFYLKNAPKLVKESGYVPLTPETYELLIKRVEDRISGSVFLSSRSTVGVKIEELIQEE
ncbi:PstS family phosphate ABC transporter substrate-binding protein [Cytophagaceae bacterium ABcell3]|nr:PstS family phosphate ABC transporter substrate-binding protein [Cytophagaceae bacterium ABcell3]